MTWNNGDHARILGTFTGLPAGTLGTVEPIGTDGLMLWFTPDDSLLRIVPVRHYEIERVDAVPTPTVPCQRCGLRPADGSRIMCVPCWVETGEPT